MQEISEDRLPRAFVVRLAGEDDRVQQGRGIKLLQHPADRFRAAADQLFQPRFAAAVEVEIGELRADVRADPVLQIMRSISHERRGEDAAGAESVGMAENGKE